MATKNVMEQWDFGKSIFYQVGCGCGNKECNMVVELEYDEGTMYLNFYKDVAFSVYWNDTNIFTRTWRRIKYALRILFTGHIELEETHVFHDPEHIDAFIEALLEGKERLLEYERVSQNTDGVSS